MARNGRLGLVVPRSTAALLLAGVLAACPTGCPIGDSVPPQPLFSQDSVDFGAVAVGATEIRYVGLTNGHILPDRVDTLRDVQVVLEGPDLAFQGDGCNGVVLEQAGTCIIAVTWTPSSAYVLAGRLTVTSNAPSSPISVPVTGSAGP
jgi:hypothetical protein